MRTADSAMADSEIAPTDFRLRIWSAFACGALTGALFGLLWAPARGRETRKRILRRARDGYRRTAKAATRNRRAIARQRKHVDAFIDKARTQVGDIRGDVAGAVREATSAFGRGKREASDR